MSLPALIKSRSSSSRGKPTVLYQNVDSVAVESFVHLVLSNNLPRAYDQVKQSRLSFSYSLITRYGDLDGKIPCTPRPMHFVGRKVGAC